jgi:hypothetical protein
VRLIAILAAGALLLAASGCGGSGSSSGSSSSTSTTTTTTASATKGGAGGRLSAADWSAYESAAASAQSVNQQGIVTFKGCRVVFSGNPTAAVVKTCFGNSTGLVLDEGKILLTDLQGFASRSGGACHSALATNYSNVKLYVSSVNALNLSATQGNVPEIQSVNTALAQLARAHAAAAKVPPLCKPA